MTSTLWGLVRGPSLTGSLQYEQHMCMQANLFFWEGLVFLNASYQ